MFRAPIQVQEALLSVTRRRIVLEWSNDRKNWYPIQAGDSEYTSDATSQVRWYGKATVLDAPASFNALTTRVRAFLEIRGVRMDWFRIPMGIYRVENAKRYNRRFADITFNGYEQIVRDHSFSYPRTFPAAAKDSKRKTLETLVRESVPEARFLWANDTMIAEGNKEMPKITIDKDRWSLIDGDSDANSITASFGADCYVDRIGTFVIAPTPSLKQQSVWSIEVGEGVRVASTTESSREAVKNVWSVWADPGNNKKIIGPVHVWDSDPKSPTYAGLNPILFGARDASSFGIVPGRYQNPLVTSVDALTKVAAARLAKSLGVKKKVSITSVFNPLLDAGDVVSLTPEGETAAVKLLVDKITFSPDDAYTELEVRDMGPIGQEETDSYPEIVLKPAKEKKKKK